MENNIFFHIKRLFRFLTLLVMPGGLVVLATYLLIYYSAHIPWLDRVEKTAPYIILSVGILLGWRFHRSRLAFVILILFLSERSLYYFGAGGLFSFGHDHSILLSNCILLPVNIALFYLVKERGVFNLGGIARIIFILMQPLVIFLMLRLQPDVFQYLSHHFIQHPVLDKLPLPQPVIFIYGLVAFIFLAGSLFGKGGPTIRGFFWALVATLLGLLAENSGASATLYYAAAGLIIIIAVLETAYSMAFQDELTGLPTRRALSAGLHGLGKRYAIAMLDIDFFKKFNDRYGHDVGDQVLCMVASHLKRVGGGGKPFRYGGEEFTMLFPGKTREEAIPHLERLREAIEAAQFILRGKNRPKKTPRKQKKSTTQARAVSVTISIGVAEPGKGCAKPSAVIKAADQALYRAKKRGRKCTAT
jgi:diguanylate cyclase (GGDEF)-like protein